MIVPFLRCCNKRMTNLLRIGSIVLIDKFAVLKIIYEVNIFNQIRQGK